MVARLSSIRGQERAIALLRRYLASGTTPDGLLFTGEEGVGKESAALAFVSALLCRAAGADGACGSCPDCRLLASGGHPNLLRIVPETPFLRIDEIRALKEELSLKAFSDRPRAAILVPADRMTPQAANALLKTLEEPPPGTHLLLVAHRVSHIMPTIVSRCQRVPFFPLPAEAVAEILAGLPESAGRPPEEIRLAAALSGGSPGRALAILPELTDERETWLSLLSRLSPREAIDFCETWKAGGDSPGRLAAPLSLARDLALLSSGGGADIMNADLRAALERLAAHPPAGGWDGVFRAFLSVSRMPPQPQKRLALEAFFFGLHGKG
jgi:DNA polymerase-3 subunit delta'